MGKVKALATQYPSAECSGCDAIIEDVSPEQLAKVNGFCIDCLILALDPPAESEPEKRSLKLSVDGLPGCEGKSLQEVKAHVQVDPIIQAAVQSMKFGIGTSDTTDTAPGLSELAAAVQARVDKVIDSNSSEGSMEALAAQSVVLDMFGNHMLRVVANSKNLATIDAFSKFGLRAFSLSRACLVELEAIKNPPLKQVNVAHGHQQVNTKIGRTDDP